MSQTPHAQGLCKTASRKWWICGLLLLASAINYMDRQTLANASVRITHEFGLAQEQYGNLEAGFGWAFAAGSIVFGLLADRLPLRWLYAVVLVLWSAVGFATSYARDYNGLLVCRTLLGFFEAGHWPCGIKATRLLLDPHDRPLGNSMLQGGVSIGAIISVLMMGALKTDVSSAGTSGDWRWAFQAVGATGFVWLVAWLGLVRSRDFAPAAAESPARVDAGNAASDWWRVLLSRRMAVVLVVVALINTTWQMLRVWLPKFLEEGRGYHHVEALRFNAVWFVATDAGCLGAGILALWLTRRGFHVTRSRLLVFATCAGLSAVTLALPVFPHGWPLLAVLLVAGAGALGLFPIYHAFTQDLSGEHQAKVTGFAGIAAWGFSPLAQKLFGRLIDRTGSFDAGLAVAGALPLIALLCLALFWGRDETKST